MQQPGQPFASATTGGRRNTALLIAGGLLGDIVGRRRVLLGCWGAFQDPEVVDYAAPGEELRALEPGETSSGFFGVSPQPEYETTSLLGAVPDAGSRASSTGATNR